MEYHIKHDTLFPMLIQILAGGIEAMWHFPASANFAVSLSLLGDRSLDQVRLGRVEEDKMAVRLQVNSTCT
jgi:predicted dinucleotide-utilizing enzyme